MRYLVITIFSLVLAQTLFGQQRYLFGANNVSSKPIISKVIVDKNLRGNFSFTKMWNYPEGIFKDANTGEFITNGNPFDTTHLFYTANCSTNVQGGYNIRYCYASKDKNNITLAFTDGFPAHASRFYVHVKAGNFWSNVETIYPVIIEGQKKSCKIVKQILRLERPKYSKGDTIKGVVEIEFIETVSVPNKLVQRHKYFFKGYFKTVLS